MPTPLQRIRRHLRTDDEDGPRPSWAGLWSAEQDAYLVSLANAPLSAQTRRTYASKARQYLAWLAVAETDGDALGTVEGRDWAVRDYRRWRARASRAGEARLRRAL